MDNKLTSLIRSQSKSLWQWQKEIVLAVLKKHDWNLTHTARELGIAIMTLKNHLRDWNISRPAKR